MKIRRFIGWGTVLAVLPVVLLTVKPDAVTKGAISHRTDSTSLRWFSQPAQAVQLADGKVYFVNPPRLLKAITTDDTIRVWGATYYFTLDLPEDAGEPLQKVAIKQHQGSDRVYYDLAETVAFEGTYRKAGPLLPLQSVTQDRDSQTLWVAFEPPVEPGRTLSIALYPEHNPAYSGVYLFGVTAFPAGERSHGQFLGFGRLHFYGDGRGFLPYGW